MSFLENLRMSNIFPRKPATDRPFGMPEMDDEPIERTLGRLMPLARNINDDQDRRDQDMMKFEFDLKHSREPRPLSPLEQMSAAHTVGARGGQREAATQINSGPTPMQKMFQERDALERANKFKTQQSENEMTGRYRQAMDVENVQQSAANMRNAEDIIGRGQVNDADNASRGIQARDKMRFDQQEAERASGRKMTEQAADRRNQGDQDRLTNAAKPIITPPRDADKVVLSKVQELKLNNPDLGKFITQSDDGMFTVSRNAPPEAIAAIKAHMGGSPAPGAAPPPGKPGVITQKNKVTGKTRTSADGGKTWVNNP